MDESKGCVGLDELLAVTNPWFEMRKIIAIELFLTAQVLGLHFECRVQELRNLLEAELVPHLPGILSNFRNINPMIGMMKGSWPGLRRLVNKSCAYWDLELFQSLLERIRHDSYIQSYLLAPTCLQRLSFKLPPLKPEDGHCWLPPEGPKSASELIDTIENLAKTDPLGWYRADYLHKSLVGFLGLACQEYNTRIINMNLKVLLPWVPDLKDVKNLKGWVNLLVKKAFSPKDDQERAAIYFYIFHQFNATNGLKILKSIHLEWRKLYEDNEEWEFLQFLQCPNKITTGAAMGIGDNSAIEVFHLAVFVAIRNNRDDLLSDFSQILERRLAKYTPFELSHLLHYIYRGCFQGIITELNILKVRGFLGEEGIRRIREEVFLPIHWESLYFVLSGPERILNFRHWNYSAPKVEWPGIKQEIDDNIDINELFRISWEFYRKLSVDCCPNLPRNLPETNIWKDLKQVIQQILKKFVDLNIISISNETCVFSLKYSFQPNWILIKEVILMWGILIYLTAYHRLHVNVESEKLSIFEKHTSYQEVLSTIFYYKSGKRPAKVQIFYSSWLAIIYNFHDVDRHLLETIATLELTNFQHSNL